MSSSFTHPHDLLSSAEHKKNDLENVPGFFVHSMLFGPQHVIYVSHGKSHTGLEQHEGE